MFLLNSRLGLFSAAPVSYTHLYAGVVYPQATVTGLTAGESYDFSILAYNDAGVSVASSTLTLPKTASADYTKLLNLVTEAKAAFEEWRGMRVETLDAAEVARMENALKAATAVLANSNATADDYNAAYTTLEKAGERARSIVDAT